MSVRQACRFLIFSLILFSLSSFAFAQNFETNNFFDKKTNTPTNQVQAIMYKCTDASCTAPSGGQLVNQNSGAATSLVIAYPDTPSETHYAKFLEKTCYMPQVWNMWSYGSGFSFSSDIKFHREPRCVSVTDGLLVVNSGNGQIPVTLGVKSNFDASAHSSFILSNDVVKFFSPNTDQYSAETKLTLKIYDSNGNLVFTDSKTLNILMYTTQNVHFEWTPGAAGKYTAELTTELTDCQCEVKPQKKLIKTFTVIAPNKNNYCYALLNQVSINDQFPQPGEPIKITANKIANAINSQGQLTPLAATVTANVYFDGNLVFTQSKQVASGQSAVSFDAGTYQKGNYVVIVDALADNCPYNESLGEKVSLEFASIKKPGFLCGDGVKASDEQCDDGNANNNDGCSEQCKYEFCGDNIVKYGEQCDDGNSNNNDQCNQCQKTVCGDGIIQNPNGNFQFEECDDGNQNNNDACNNYCKKNLCGDGIKQDNEQCDDGNQNNNDACTNACLKTFCGDGTIQYPNGNGQNEYCDDGNTNNNDGCSSICKIEKCGDGVKQSNEECDDGNQYNNDQCNNQCVLTWCGDSIIQNPNGDNQNEQCDDGNTNNNDGCSNVCKNEICGDGIKQSNEQCDDGNTLDGDGCSSQCKIQECVKDADCSNGLFCDGTEKCDLYTYTCQPGTPPACNDGLFCNGLEYCREEYDMCKPGTPVACSDGAFCNGVEVCNEQYDTCKPGTPVACDNGKFCDGTEVCNENYDRCDSGTPVACDNGKFCDGTEVCSEEYDMCKSGTPVACDNGQFCDGLEVCDESKDACKSGTPVACSDGQFCNGVEYCNEDYNTCKPGTPVACDNGQFCDGTEYCNEQYDSCKPGTPVQCSDGQYCNGQEYCNENYDTCKPGTVVDCSANNITGINTCLNNPDYNNFTIDLRNPFKSVCDEYSDSCTLGNKTITHSCDVICGADSVCQGKNPGQWPCDGNCKVECTKDADCSNGLFCDGTEKCDLYTYTCKPGTPPACNDGLFCNGVEYCSEEYDMCKSGTPVACDNGQFCDGTEVCDESKDACKPGTPVYCNDHQFCNGLEVCNEDLNKCASGTPVACDNGQFCDGTEVCNENYDRCDAGTPVQCGDGKYCNGVEYCNEDYNTCKPGTPVACDNGQFCDGVETCNEYNDSCNQGTPVLCDDGKFCNGKEYCNEDYNTCKPGVAIDCSINNITGISTCFNNPDKNNFTIDLRNPFVSVCDEYSDSCTLGNKTITHACDVVCGADSVCQGKNPGQWPCDGNCKVECTKDADCDNGLFCDGKEVCDLETYTCKSGTPVVCKDGEFCDGVEVCNEEYDRCDAGTPIQCSDGAFCNGQEYCNEQYDTCKPGTPIKCDDGLYCNGLELCDEYSDKCVTDALIPIDDHIACTDDKCIEANDTVMHTPQNNLCDDWLFCNGQEVCVADVGCVKGPIIDCSINNITGINTCFNNPDKNNYTIDIRNPFKSVCDEEKNSCTTSNSSINHYCDVVCGADSVCQGKNPGQWPCDGNCKVECTKDADCSNGLFCDGTEKCDLETYTCKSGTPPTCDNGAFCDGLEVCDESKDACKPGTPIYCNDHQFCNGVEYCNEDYDMCKSGTPVACDNGKFCDGTEVCNEYEDKCVSQNPPKCDDGLFCNGEETCDEESNSCKSGTPMVCDDGLFCNGEESCSEETKCCVSGTKVDCSANNITGINTCLNNPDQNNFTIDLRNPFVSVCDEYSNSCTLGNKTITHACDVVCNADPACQGKNPGQFPCDANCQKIPQCGNEIVEAGEQCDDGNQNNNDQCDNYCKKTFCGDSIIQHPNGNGQNEYCDDGNTNNNDGCSSICKIEKCGDSIKQSNEQCDDGNTNNNDGCSNICKLEACGDGIINKNENVKILELKAGKSDEKLSVTVKVQALKDFDDVQVEAVLKDVGSKTSDTFDMHSGITYIQNLDIPFTSSPGIYLLKIRIENINGPIFEKIYTVKITEEGATLDFVLAEECDDGNTNNNDGCSSICKIEKCGDSIKQSNEQCDDGNVNNNDGCSSICKLELCGDSIKQSNEQCDDGNTNNNDGCSSVCKNEICGDGIKQSTEQCDDGNNLNGDGCSSICKTEQCNKNADCQDNYFCNGQEVCDLETYTCKSGTPPVCDNGQFCDGTEVCNEQYDRCDLGTPVACSDGQFCNGQEVCNEDLNKCVLGTPISCDNGQYCDGIEVCDESKDACKSGAPVVCTDSQYCNGIETCNEETNSCQSGTPVACSDGKYCNGLETCNENTDSCKSGTPVACNDGQYCNGVEVCNEDYDRCDSGVNVDCSINDINGINTCLNNPDNNQYTKDTRAQFTSSCNENTDSCTLGNKTITHVCDQATCGAQCDSNSDCSATPCDWLDGCYGTYYLDFTDAQNTCTNGCSCTNNQCKNPIIHPNDPRCIQKECTKDADCDNGLFCDGKEVCDLDTYTCEDGSAPVCDDGAFCNGQEYCNEQYDSCKSGSVIDCSVNNINGINTCTNVPDGNQYTKDTRAQFISMCDEEKNSCTTGNSTITHICDDACGANIKCDGKSPGQANCDLYCQVPECLSNADCNNNLYCDGQEVCDLQTNTCKAGAPILCADSLFCNGQEVCDETQDKCIVGTPVVCSDGKFCNGLETCSEQSKACLPGVIVDCSVNNIPGVATCLNNPDSNSKTYDSRIAFTSTCNEEVDSCTLGNNTITHLCELTCGADIQCDGVPAGTDGCTASCTYKQCTKDADCNNNLYCDGQEVCDLNTFQCKSGTAPIVNDGIACTQDSCDESTDKIKHVADNSVCDDGLYCNGVEVCVVGEGCVSGTKVDCSINNITGINTCMNSPDNNPYTRDLRNQFVSVCDEEEDACTMGSSTLTHICDDACGAQIQCDGKMPGQDDCSIECKFKPPRLCVRDGEYGIDFETGHQYVCDDDNTYFECNEFGSGYVHQNICSYQCSADLACNGIVPGASLGACNIGGQTYLEDYCDLECHLKDDNCEDDMIGCTANAQCDESAPGTNGCTMVCQPVGCEKDSDCSDGQFCNGAEKCDLVSGQCQSGNAPACQDNKFCNGQEVCDEATDTCKPGVAIDCSINNIPGINTCLNVPDGNQYTKDTRAQFTSVCNENTNSCTTGTSTIVHTCDLVCGAECSSDSQCDEISCGEGCYLDDELVSEPEEECFGTTECEFRDYDDASGSCNLNTCSCTMGTCSDYEIDETDVDNDGFDTQCDMDCDDSDNDVYPNANELCDGKDNDCDGLIDESLFGGDFRISYASRGTGDVIYMNGFVNNFTFERIDFFHGYVRQYDGKVQGFGSFAARATLPDGKKINLNIKFDVTEILERDCLHIKWRNSARGTFWIEGVGTNSVVLEYMDISYNLLTGEIDSIGFGEVPFKFEDMVDKNFGGG